MQFIAAAPRQFLHQADDDVLDPAAPDTEAMLERAMGWAPNELAAFANRADIVERFGSGFLFDGTPEGLAALVGDLTAAGCKEKSASAHHAWETHFRDLRQRRQRQASRPRTITPYTATSAKRCLDARIQKKCSSPSAATA